MQRLSLFLCLLGGFLIPSARAQSTPAAEPAVGGATPTASAPSTPPAANVAGGLVHGTVKAGNVPLPGVSVVATNTLTGQRYATITDINGNYSMTIPVNGRYVLKTELAAFAPETKVALVKPTATTPSNQQADFTLTLASRIPPESPQENAEETRLKPPGRGERCGEIAAAGRRIWPCLQPLPGRQTQELTAAQREQPCLRWRIIRISPLTRLPSRGRQAQRIPLPVWTWNNFARTRSWISRSQAGEARAAKEVAADRVVDPEEVRAAAVVLEEEVLEVVAAASAEGDAAVAAEEVAVLAAAASVIFATSKRISHMAPSFGRVEIAR